MKYTVLFVSALLSAAYTCASALPQDFPRSQDFSAKPKGIRNQEQDEHSSDLQKFFREAIKEAESIFEKVHAAVEPHHEVSRPNPTSPKPAENASISSEDSSSVPDDYDADSPAAGVIPGPVGLDVSDDSSSSSIPSSSPSPSSDEDEWYDEVGGEDEDSSGPISFPGGLLGTIFSKATSFSGNMAWWKGPNVCVERDESGQFSKSNSSESSQDESDTGRHFGLLSENYHFSSCSQTPTVYECVTRVSNNGVRKTYTVTYRCCHGSQRNRDKPGCTEVNRKTALDTAGAIGATAFRRLVLSNEQLLPGKLSRNYTIFAPVDTAVQEFLDSLTVDNQVEVRMRRRAPDLSPTDDDWSALLQAAIRGAVMDTIHHRGGNEQPSDSEELSSDQEIVQPETNDPVDAMILNQQVNGILDLQSVPNEKLMPSHRRGGVIRINSYPSISGGRTWTANCARVLKPNIPAADGMVHLVERVVPYVRREHTVAHLLENDARLSTFRKLLETHGLLDIVKSKGPITLLAPTNDAFFREGSEEMRERLMERGGCADAILRQHIIRHTVCASAAEARIHAPNLEGEYLTIMNRSNDGRLFVNNVEVIHKDIVASNGVLHVLDNYIFPQSARSLPETLKESNLTKWHDLLEKTKVMDIVSRVKNVTIFAPTNDALASAEAQRLISDDTAAGIGRLRHILLYHIGHPAIEDSEFSDDKEISTEQGEQAIHMNIYRTVPLFGDNIRITAECGRVVSVDHKACGAVVHKVDRLLVPPSKTLRDLVMERPDLGIFRMLMNGTSFMDLLSKDPPAQRMTLLAIPDSAFEAMGEDFLDALLRYPAIREKFFQTHVLPFNLCCTGVGDALWPFFMRARTVRTSFTHKLRRDAQKRVYIGNAMASQCDIMGTNGVMHIVDQSAVTLPELESLKDGPVSKEEMEPSRVHNVKVIIRGI